MYKKVSVFFSFLLPLVQYFKYDCLKTLRANDSALKILKKIKKKNMFVLE